MAVKKTTSKEKENKGAPLKFGAFTFTPPADYEEPAALAQISDEEITQHARGKKEMALIPVLTQAAAELEENPDALRTEPDHTPALMNQLASLLAADDALKTDLDLLTEHILSQRRRHRAQANKVILSLLGQLKLQAKKDPTLLIRFSHLAALYKKPKP